jgi:hypothetical protein
MTQTRIASRLLPGGDLIAALFDRDVMTLADRGGASNLIGDRWADLAAAEAATWVGSEQSFPRSGGYSLHITRVDRLDANPRIAAAASKRGLQNPDLLLIGEREGEPVMRAGDAKFSVETARSKQVSPEVVRNLLLLRDELPELFPAVDDDLQVEPGVFLSPDFPLTHLMLRRRHGIVRTTVRPDEVVLVPVAPEHFWDGVEGASILAPLAAVDRLPVRPETSLLAGVYYFRLARAAVGFWLDATKPLLLNGDLVAVDEGAIRDQSAHRARTASSAIGLIEQWDADVQTIRNQRAAVEQVAGLPIAGRDLREMVARIAGAAGAEPPSANQVRRRLGAWFRGALRERVGPISPPIADLSPILRDVAAASRELAPRVEPELERVVRELITQTAAREAAAGSIR